MKTDCKNYEDNTLLFKHHSKVRYFMIEPESERPGRSKTQRHKFTKEEDDRLLHLVYQFGTKSWKHISQLMKTRSTRQCRERYLNYLSPDLTNGPWTVSEEKLLLSKVREYGTCWSKIGKFFPSRSEVNIKNRYALFVSRGKAPDIKKKRKQKNSGDKSEKEVAVNSILCSDDSNEQVNYKRDPKSIFPIDITLDWENEELLF